MGKQLKKKKLDKGYYREAIDRTHVLACTFEDHIMNHRAVSETPKLKKKAEKISELLGDLYQEIGIYS